MREFTTLIYPEKIQKTPNFRMSNFTLQILEYCSYKHIPYQIRTSLVHIPYSSLRKESQTNQA